jgi:hypothetical protein
MVLPPCVKQPGHGAVPALPMCFHGMEFNSAQMQPLTSHLNTIENQQILTNPNIINQNRLLNPGDKGTMDFQKISNYLPQKFQI